MVKFPDVSEERTASIFMVEEEAKEASRSMLISCLTYFSSVETVVVHSSEMPLNVKTTRRHIPDDNFLNKILFAMISFAVIFTASLIQKDNDDN
jgi:hypothetical protein